MLGLPPLLPPGYSLGDLALHRGLGVGTSASPTFQSLRSPCVAVSVQSVQG